MRKLPSPWNVMVRVGTPASYSEWPWFKSRPRAWTPRGLFKEKICLQTRFKNTFFGCPRVFRIDKFFSNIIVTFGINVWHIFFAFDPPPPQEIDDIGEEGRWSAYSVPCRWPDTVYTGFFRGFHQIPEANVWIEPVTPTLHFQSLFIIAFPSDVVQFKLLTASLNKQINRHHFENG
jgi:hypothetical protein